MTLSDLKKMWDRTEELPENKEEKHTVPPATMRLNWG